MQKIETYVSIADGTDLVKMTEKRFDKSVKDAHAENEKKKEGEPLTTVPESVHRQTFAKYEAESLEEAQTLSPDVNVLLTFYNRGLSLHLENLISGLLTDSGFQPVEGVYDLLENCGRLPERTRTKKALSTDDMLAHIKALPKEQRDAIIQEFMSVLAAD